MAKKRQKRKRRTKKAKATRFIDLDMSSMESPFPKDDPQGLAEFAEAVQTSGKEEFAQSLAKLKSLVRELDLSSIMTMTSFFDVLLADQPGLRSWNREPLTQAEVEFLQALFLAVPEEEGLGASFRPHGYEDISKELKHLSRSFMMKRFGPGGDDRGEHSRRMLSEFARMHTQSVRHWGTGDQVFRIIEDMLGVMDVDLAKRHGVTVTGIVGLFRGILRLSEKRSAKHLKHVRHFLSKETRSAVIKAYSDIVDNEDMVEGMDRFTLEKQISTEQVKGLLFTHYSIFFLSEQFVFTSEELDQLYPEEISKACLSSVLETWAMGSSDLVGKNEEHFLLDNPVWTRPFIRLEGGSYFLPILPSLQAFGLDMIESLMKQDADLLKKYSRVRSDYLEQATASLIEKEFAGARIYRNSEYFDPESGDKYENDILAIIDSYALVIECKSGQFSPAARRGAPDRLKRDVSRLVDEPASQAMRFAKHLKKHMSSDSIPVVNGEDIEWSSRMKRIIPIAMTFEMLGPLACGKRSMIEAGLLGKDTGSVLAICYPDMEAICKLLPMTCSKLHYLERRSALEVHLNLLADEMDLLTFYFDNGFNIGDMEFEQGRPMMLYGIAKEFSEFLLSEELGRQVPRPVQKLTSRWRKIIAFLEQRQSPGWTILAGILLNVGYDEQKAFENRFKVTTDIVQKKWQVEGHENTVFAAIGPVQRRDVIAALAIKRVSRQVRDDMMSNAVNRAAEHSPNRLVLVIVIDVEENTDPYASICLAEART